MQCALSVFLYEYFLFVCKMHFDIILLRYVEENIKLLWHFYDKIKICENKSYYDIEQAKYKLIR